MTSPSALEPIFTPAELRERIALLNHRMNSIEARVHRLEQQRAAPYQPAPIHPDIQAKIDGLTVYERVEQQAAPIIPAEPPGVCPECRQRGGEASVLPIGGDGMNARLDAAEAMAQSLGTMTALVRLRYGNLDEMVSKAVDQADAALAAFRSPATPPQPAAVEAAYQAFLASENEPETPEDRTFFFRETTPGRKHREKWSRVATAVLATASEAEGLRRERDWLKRREATIIEALRPADGGDYSNDITESISRLIRERADLDHSLTIGRETIAALSERLEEARRALEELDPGNPGRTDCNERGCGECSTCRARSLRKSFASPSAGTGVEAEEAASLRAALPREGEGGKESDG